MPVPLERVKALVDRRVTVRWPAAVGGGQVTMEGTIVRGPEPHGWNLPNGRGWSLYKPRDDVQGASERSYVFGFRPRGKRRLKGLRIENLDSIDEGWLDEANIQ